LKSRSSKSRPPEEPKNLSERINSLPKWAREYIHELEARADPAGDVQELIFLRDQNKALIKLVGELRRRPEAGKADCRRLTG